MNSTGTLIPIGGNEDKGINEDEQYHLEFIEESILSRVVKESGGRDAMIAIIPTASSIPEKVSESYTNAFGKLGCTNLHILDIRERWQAEASVFISVIQKADCVMFSGGNQSKITQIIGESTIHKILMQRYQRGKLVIAGTSAGAMCMTKEMITGGSSQESFIKGAVGLSDGMKFVNHLIIDSHFIRRGRFGRLAEAVAKFPDLIGIGLAEDTGLVIKNNVFEVIGSGMVILFDARNAKHNNHALMEDGMPMSLTNLKTSILASGDLFNIKKKKVKVHPIHLAQPDTRSL